MNTCITALLLSALAGPAAATPADTHRAEHSVTQHASCNTEWITIGEVELEGIAEYGKYPPQREIKATLEVMELNKKLLFRIKYNNQYYTTEAGEGKTYYVRIGKYNYKFANTYAR